MEQKQLQQINKSLMLKPFVYVVARQGCVKYRICIMRADNGQFAASVAVKGETFRGYGRKGSDAAREVVTRLRRRVRGN